MKLDDLPEGARIFVDANILIYHFSGISLELYFPLNLSGWTI